MPFFFRSPPCLRVFSRGERGVSVVYVVSSLNSVRRGVFGIERGFPCELEEGEEERRASLSSWLLPSSGRQSERARERERREGVFFFRCWCSGSRRTLQFRVTGALEGASKFYALAYARMRELSYMTQYRALGGAREWRREEEREKWGVESEPKKKDRKKPTHRYDCRRFSRFFRDAPPAPSPTSSAPFKAA